MSEDTPRSVTRQASSRPAPGRTRRARGRAPGLAVERSFWNDGVEYVAGMDEVGRGSWAGPLTIAVTIVPRDRRVNRIRDSKQLTEAARESMFDRIAEWCDDWAIGHVQAEECDEIGMSAAQRLAATRALEGLTLRPDVVLVDGNWDFVGGGPWGTATTRTIVKGDATSLSIAAASILAKVTRDRLMRADADNFPAFCFDSNKGYPCPRHKLALMGYGPTSIHRRSWAFMDDLVWDGVVRAPLQWLDLTEFD